MARLQDAEHAIELAQARYVDGHCTVVQLEEDVEALLEGRMPSFWPTRRIRGY
jgi:hypothetical protein